LSQPIGNVNVYQSVVEQSASLQHRVLGAIRKASAASGVDFSYLLNKASQESGLNPSARASTSSASGLFQFIEQTWLRVVKTYGAKYGLEEVAGRINIGADGVARVSDSPSRKAILDLRNDPDISACMAAELAKDNKEALECKTGEKAGPTELYLAHFLGVSGAAAFIKAMRADPSVAAADVLPEAASANRQVFYNKDGSAKSLGEIYNRFAVKFERGPQVASAGGVGIQQTRLAMPAVPIERYSGGTQDYDAVLADSPLLSSPASSGKKPVYSSQFAAMVLAQMGAGGLEMLESPHTAMEENGGGQRKKQTLGSGLN